MTKNSSSNSRRWLTLFLKTGSKIGLGLFLLLIIAIGLGQWWAKTQLAPLVSQELTKTLKRPFSIGNIQDIWLNEIHVTNAKIPASGDDLTRIEAPDVIINFNPFDLFARKVKLDVRLVDPRIYLSQNSRGNWVDIPKQDKNNPPPIKVEVGTIKIENARVEIVPYSSISQPIVVSKVNLQADVNDTQERVKFDGGAQFGDRGQVQVQGNSLIANSQTQLVIKGKQLDAAAATRIVKIPEVTIARGTVDGDLNLAIQPGKYLQIKSNLLVNNGKLVINHVPRSLDEINGFIQVSERAVEFKNVTTKYDRVAGVINGTLDYTTGYRLNAKTAPIALNDVFKSIDVKSPFVLTGAAVASLQLTGKLDRPILAGQFHNSQLSQVDRVQIDRVNGNFRLADGRIKLDAIAQPKLGGKITTQGEIQLLKTPQTRFQVQGEHLAGDALSRLYGAKLPTQMQLGNTSVQGTIGGAGAEIYTNLRVAASQATYPVITDLQITPQGQTIVRGATLAVAGGKVQATGEVTKTNWRLNLQPQGLDTQQLAQIGGINLAANYSGKLGGNFQAAGSNSDLEIDRIQARGNLNLKLPAGQIIADRINVDRGNWQANVSSNALDLQQLDPNTQNDGALNFQLPKSTVKQPAIEGSKLPPGTISGSFNVSGNSLKQITPETILARGGGRIRLAAGEVVADNLTLANGDWQGLFTTKNLQLSEFNSQVGGRLSGKANLAGNIQSFAPESIRGAGQGELNLSQGKIVGKNLQLDRGKWQGNLQSSALVLGGLAPEIPLKFRNAKVDSNVRVAGDLKHLKPQALTIAGTAKLSVAGGSILARELEIRSGKWRGNFGVDRLQLGSVSDAVPTNFAATKLTGNFAAAGDLTKFDLARLQVTGDGDLNFAGGKVRATDVRLVSGNWSSNLAISSLKLGDVNDRLSPQLQASKLSGNFNVAGKVDNLVPAAIQASGNGNLKIANGGEIRATNFQTNAGAWQSDLAIRNLKLGSLNSGLPPAIQAGLLSGNFNAAGNLDTPDLEGVQAKGNGQISSILGGNIQIDNLSIDRGRWQSQVIAKRLNLGQLCQFAPKQIGTAIGTTAPIENRLAGQLSANWQLGGNLQTNSLANIQVVGATKLTNLQVGTIKFDPTLNGTIQANPGQGVDIAFAGKNDRLALTLDRNLQPQTFDVEQQQTSIKGNVNGKLLNVSVDRLPIALLQPLIPKTAGLQTYRLDGTVKGNVTVDLAKNLHVTGNQIEITNPIFGAFEGERLAANFRYHNGSLNLNNTELQRGKYTYRIVDANIIPGATTPNFQAKLQIPNGSIEDLRNLLQIFSLNDVFKPLNQRKYGTAADLGTQTSKLANRPQPLYNELRRLSELRRWLNREADRQEEANFIPDIGNLQGDFNGEISIANTPKTGLSSDFNIAGTNWQLDRYHLDGLQATGNWRNGKLHFDPLKLTIADSQIAIAGDFSANSQNAKVNVKNFPIESLTSLITLPVDIKGGINLAAEIGGTMANPRTSGQISLINGKLNNIKLQPEVVGTFNYWDGRLNFAGDASFADRPMVAQEDRIKITGSIPYQLPFALKTPASRNIRVDLSLQNQGLQILDVFSNQQLHWLDGQGKIALKIDGMMKPSSEGIESLTASGTANIIKGRIQSESLPEPITDVNGDIIFDFDRIEVQKLSGQLARGQFIAAGIIPISDSFAIATPQQLGVQMNGINIKLKEKYSGDVNGKLTVVGTALTPILTGKVQLSNGRVFLPEAQNTTSTVLGIQPAAPADPNPNALQLRNLELTLGDNLQITRAPILNFIATGKLDLNGTIDNPRPFGQVQLKKGSVNLFTTEFRLASGPQTADFFPTLGPDPVLNLRLYAKTLESTSTALSQRSSIISNAKNGEIDRPADFYTTSLGSVQTVQVEARIAGLASQLTQRLELTSTPARTQPEIVLLLGGAIAERLSSGGDIGLGVVSLASSNLLNTIQDRVSEIFSLSDFRLFPTITRDTKTNSTSTFGIAAEVGTEITPKISASVFKILTNSESPYYSLRYRVSDQVLLRGSTNLFGENRAIVEFEQRF